MLKFLLDPLLGPVEEKLSEDSVGVTPTGVSQPG